MPATEQEREKFQPLSRASQDGQILKETIMADSVSNIRIAESTTLNQKHNQN